MAKTNMVEREKRRAKIVKKYAAKRALLKELIRSPKTNPEVRADAQVKLQKLPRDASPSPRPQPLRDYRPLPRRVSPLRPGAREGP